MVAGQVNLSIMPETLATADRVMHHAHLIDTVGEPPPTALAGHGFVPLA
jgi:hypothetical protein